MKVLVLLLLSLSLSYAYDFKRAIAPEVNWSEYPFTVLILGVGTSNSIEHICSGSVLNTEGKASHILTTAYCIQNRTDPSDSSKSLRLVVLVPSSNGTVLLGSNTFSEFLPFQTIKHPQAGAQANFNFVSTLPNGTQTSVNAVIDTNDVGIIRLRGLVNVTGVRNVTLGTTVPTNGTRIDLLGYGGPGFYSLHKTTSLVVIPSRKTVNGANTTNNEMIFFQDTESPRNSSQAVEIGDEGGPLLFRGSDGRLVQVGIAQGTWRISGSDGLPITYASLGPAVVHYQDFVQKVLTEKFVLPTDSNNTSGASSLGVSVALFFFFVLRLIH